MLSPLSPAGEFIIEEVYSLSTLIFLFTCSDSLNSFWGLITGILPLAGTKFVTGFETILGFLDLSIIF